MFTLLFRLAIEAGGSGSPQAASPVRIVAAAAWSSQVQTVSAWPSTTQPASTWTEE